MYKELKNDLEDKRILEELISSKKERIKYIIQKELGVHATSYTELKIQCPVIDDKNARVFGKIEKLDREVQILEGEYKIIESSLNNIDKIMSTMDSTEKKIFRNRYILGLSVRSTAEKMNYSVDWIKEKTRKMFQK
ncbi:MAG: hypothetical protein E7168_03845 [Firmicutes bacterium]|nr:hypothetical protein [Bacillota bacterium]